MRVLLDECVDWRIKRDLPGHDITTVPEAGWAGIKNGKLLELAVSRFEVFLTVDRNLSFQQHLPRFDIAVMVIQAVTNRLLDLKPLAPQILEVLPKAKRGEITWVK